MQRRVYIVFKWFFSTQPDGLLCIHSHPWMAALSGKLVVLHDTFLVAVLTFVGPAVGQSARNLHRAILPHETFLNSPGWLSGHVSRACSGSLHLTPYERLKVIPKNCVCAFSLYWCKALHRYFPWRRNKLTASLFIMLLHWMFLLPTSLLSVLNRMGGRLFCLLSCSRTVGQELQEVLRYSIISSPTLYASLKNSCLLQ